MSVKEQKCMAAPTVTIFTEAGEPISIPEAALYECGTLVKAKEMANEMDVPFNLQNHQVIGNKSDIEAVFKLLGFVDYTLLSANCQKWITDKNVEQRKEYSEYVTKWKTDHPGVEVPDTADAAKDRDFEFPDEPFNEHDYLVSQAVQVPPAASEWLKTLSKESVVEMFKIADFLEMPLATHFLYIHMSQAIYEYEFNGWRQEFSNLIGERRVVTDNPEEDAIRLEREKAEWSIMTKDTHLFQRYPLEPDEIAVGLVLNVKQNLTPAEELAKYFYLQASLVERVQFKIYGRHFERADAE